MKEEEKNKYVYQCRYCPALVKSLLQHYKEQHELYNKCHCNSGFKTVEERINHEITNQCKMNYKKCPTPNCIKTIPKDPKDGRGRHKCELKEK